MFKRMFLLLPIFGSFSLTHQCASAEVSVKQSKGLPELTEAEKIYGLSKFWQEVNYNFAFFDQVPDLDWDKTYKEYIKKVLETENIVEYYQVLKKFASLLKDGHTDIRAPQCVKENFDEPKICLRNIQRHAIVINVGESLKDKIPLGSEIIKVEGVSTEEYLKKEVFPYIASSTEHILWDTGIRSLLKGFKGSKVTVTIETPKSNKKEVELRRNSREIKEKWVKKSRGEWRRFEFKWLDKKIAYIGINTFGDSRVVDDFKLSLPELKKCEGFIIDLRGNGGGNSGYARSIFRYLTKKAFFTAKWKTREHRAAFKAWGKDFQKEFPPEIKEQLEKNLSLEEFQWLEECLAYYKGTKWYEDGPDTIKPAEQDIITAPFVVLIGHGTASAAEDFLIMMKSVKRGVFVGMKTFGSTGQPLLFDLPRGGRARVCTRRCMFHDGREFVGYGIEPDVFVEPNVEDIVNERDLVLEKGIEVLKKEIKTKMSGSGQSDL